MRGATVHSHIRKCKKEENSSKKNKSKRTLDKNNEVGQNFLASDSAGVELAIADISNMENREPGPGVQPIENRIDRPKPKSKRVSQNPVYGDQKAQSVEHLMVAFFEKYPFLGDCELLSTVRFRMHPKIASKLDINVS